MGTQAVKELIKETSWTRSARLILPEIMFAVLNKSAVGIGLFTNEKNRRQTASLCFRKLNGGYAQTKFDRYLEEFEKSRADKPGAAMGPDLGRGRYFTERSRFRHLMHEEYIVRLKKRLANSISSDKGEDLEDEKSEEEEEEEEEEKEEEKKKKKPKEKNTRASTAVKKPKKASKPPTHEEERLKKRSSLRLMYAQLEQLQEFVFHHTLDNFERVENLDCSSKKAFALKTRG